MTKTRTKREEETVPALAKRFGLHPDQIYTWESEFIENAGRAFERQGDGDSGASEREAELLKKIGELTMER